MLQSNLAVSTSPVMFCTVPLRSIMPILFGFIIGLMYSTIYIRPTMHSVCNTVLPAESVASHVEREPSPTSSDHLKKRKLNLTPVKPKASQFNYDFRPYFVYSELGYRFKLIVGVITTESRLDSFAVAINNTWLKDMPKVLFFTAYSKDAAFHEKYNKKLNLNVIQLPDISEDSSEVELSFRTLQYMRDHYSDNYNWFMIASDRTYLNSKNLLDFLNSVNSSADFFLGHPILSYQNSQIFTTSSGKPKPVSIQCQSASGVVFSRTTLVKLVPELSICASSADKDESVDSVLANCVHRTSGVLCPYSSEMLELFVSQTSGPSILESLQSGAKPLMKATALYPVGSPQDMILIHKLFTLESLRSTYKEVHRLQEVIKATQPKLPDGVEEKTLHWPIGFPAPFKPTTRFEVIPWTYFTDSELYGSTDEEPVSQFSKADQKDISDVLATVRKALRQHVSNVDLTSVTLKNGYRRLDPLRGGEYVLDMSMKDKSGAAILRRFHLLRPFTKVEAMQMPAATEQRGIHLVLPVTKEEVNSFEKFLQMYKRVCLQTGENVVLLTVFVNVRNGQQDEGEVHDPFTESKNLIARYKKSYMWAQLPWLQVGVKHPSPILIMDIVSMKLPSNSLIFLVSLSIEFTINFLNRCRVNVVSGMQVFFPIPFAEYNPKIVYRDKQKPTFVDVHVTTGTWDRFATDAVCFSNSDYKELRMRKDDFLNEVQPRESDLLTVFSESKLHIFRAVDAELRRRYQPMYCTNTGNITEYHKCTARAGELCGSRKQLGQLVLENGGV